MLVHYVGHRLHRLQQVVDLIPLLLLWLLCVAEDDTEERHHLSLTSIFTLPHPHPSIGVDRYTTS